MSDLFHDSVPDGFIAQVWDVMGQCPQHTFQILTKRPARMRSWVTRWADTISDAGMVPGFPSARGPEAVRGTYTSGRARLFADMLDSMGDPPDGCAYPLYDWMEGQRFWPAVLPNVHLGVTAEDQDRADQRIPVLFDTPAAVRWVSVEPMLGPIDLGGVAGIDALHPDWMGGAGGGTGARHPLLDWVVGGGESGPGARPMELDWATSIRDQCVNAGVPFFFKQWGNWCRPDQLPDDSYREWEQASNDIHVIDRPLKFRSTKFTGRLLDGQTWDQYPKETLR
jgi:protein gp37